MTLNMKNYKGYEKKPYCYAHYPTVKYTQVAETPENKRLKDNTDANSKAKYQAEFQKQKGTKISVADDKASSQVKQVQAFQSQAQYQKEFKEDIIGTKTSLADDKNTAHLKSIQEQTSQAMYKKDFRENILGTATATTGDLKNSYLKDASDLTSTAKYHEDFKKNIVGTKTSVADDVSTNYYKDTQSKVTGIGYKQSASLSSRPTSIISQDGSVEEDVFTQEEEEQTPMVDQAPAGSFEEEEDLKSASVTIQECQVESKQEEVKERSWSVSSAFSEQHSSDGKGLRSVPGYRIGFKI